MTHIDEERTVWCVEAEREMDFVDKFMNSQNQMIGISYPRESHPYRRFRFKAKMVI